MIMTDFSFKHFVPGSRRPGLSGIDLMRRRMVEIQPVISDVANGLHEFRCVDGFHHVAVYAQPTAFNQVKVPLRAGQDLRGARCE